jgi:hypothetical protein
MLRGSTLNHNTSIIKSFMVLNTTVASCAIISGTVIWMHESEPGFIVKLCSNREHGHLNAWE